MIKLNQILRQNSSGVTNYSIKNRDKYSITNDVNSTGVTNYSICRNGLTYQNYNIFLRVLRVVTGHHNTFNMVMEATVTALHTPLGVYA